MCSLMLMMVEDGPGADGYDALSNSNSGGRVAGAGVCLSHLSAVGLSAVGLSAVERDEPRAGVPSRPRYINKSIPCLLGTPA